MASNDKPSRLQFVNVTPATQAEKVRNQKVVRSAAMKSFRQNQKLQRLQEQGESSSKVMIENRPQACTRLNQALEEQNLPQESTPNLKPVCLLKFGGQEAFLPLPVLVMEGLGSRTPNTADLRLVKVHAFPYQFVSRRPQQTLSITSSLVTPLGAGRVDPFRIYPVDVTGAHINEIMDHSVTFIWPGFRPVSQKSKTKIASAWYEKCTERPIVMHALLFGGSVHRDMLKNPRLTLDNPLRLFHKVQTMRLLKESLKKPREVAIDDLILAVLALSTNEVETMATNTNKMAPPFNSPLGSNQWLDVYGRISFVQAHTTALRSLVARRGGLEMIEFDGLAEVVSFSDILGATQSMSRPHFPFLDRWVQASMDVDKSHILFRNGLGSGFHDLLACGVTETAIIIFEAMADLTVVIDLHIQGILPISDMTLFIDRRNHIQHRLLSLQDGKELNYGEVSSPRMYEAIRLASMIFSVAVIFPVPPYKGIFRKLSGRLKSVADESKFDPCWQLYPNTLLWILILGGIASLDTEERVWYVQNLAAVSTSLNLFEWENVVENLKHYLWLQSACDTSGRALWQEVTRERIFTQGFEQGENQDFGYMDL